METVRTRQLEEFIDQLGQGEADRERRAEAMSALTLVAVLNAGKGLSGNATEVADRLRAKFVKLGLA
jgi:hypothetical protein